MKNFTKKSHLPANFCNRLQVYFFLLLLLGLPKLSYAQSSAELNSSFIWQNYWMASFYYSGKLETIWPQIAPLKLEVVRVGGEFYHGYIGTAE